MEVAQAIKVRVPRKLKKREKKKGLISYSTFLIKTGKNKSFINMLNFKNKRYLLTFLEKQ